ncbi:hypothetical protein BKA62DRAFT_624494 [Auriculariales sp. MPI-PUGE-AT-0066]|nr:hypothetical protein BKA62DRAFT_624494 [Auriculariales sp. MPI-PUGE-AT-0066]
MPPPYAADVITLQHLLKSTVTELVRTYDGLLIHTADLFGEVLVRVAIVVVIADLGAIRMLCGYVSISATLFCLHCPCTDDEIEHLDLSRWLPRTNVKNREIIGEWQAAKTIKDCDTITKRSGLRWSKLYRLPYWDSVNSVSIGIMHNLLEGVLERHLQVFWGIGPPEKVIKKQAAMAQDELDILSSFTQHDANEELRDLEEESCQSSQSGGASAPSTISSSDVNMDELYTGHSLNNDFPMDDLSTVQDSDSSGDSDYVDYSSLPAEFPPVSLAAICLCISQLELPTCVGRPPTNLGEKSHGSLKADNILVLFTVVFPMCLPEIWARVGSSAEHDGQMQGLLRNFVHLVAATNIAFAYETSNADADKFEQQYIVYRRTRTHIWPHHHSVPNDQIAHHIAAALRYFGPLPQLSEFAGESENGKMATVPTNNWLYDMGQTILLSIACRARLEARINDGAPDQPWLQQLYDILRPSALSSTPTQSELLATHVKAPTLSSDNYALVLAHVNRNLPLWRDCYDFPHPYGSKSLTPYARILHHIIHKNRTFAVRASHLGNSSIMFHSPQDFNTVGSGFIEAIWSMLLDGVERIFILVAAHQELSTEDQLCDPFIKHPALLTCLIYTEPSADKGIIEPAHIMCHVPLYKCPSGTFGIAHDVYVMNGALNRKRK